MFDNLDAYNIVYIYITTIYTINILSFLPNIIVHAFKIENDSFFFCPTNEYFDKTSFMNILESI